MVESAGKIVRFTAGATIETFVANEVMHDAVLYNLEVLGEAAKKIPDTVRQQHTEIDWRGIAGLRDVLSHAYFAVDDAALWKIVSVDVPRLVVQLGRIEADLS
ncbi:MAG: HepT-like ribonuclease domain-containing protein [Candidatus Rokuibacteriota bacterium]